MKEYIAKLVELSKIDKEIDSFVPKIAEVEERLNQAKKDVETLKENILKIDEEIKECEVKKAKNELHLKELAEKLKEIEKKSAQVKTEKELKALQLEEDIAKEQINFAHEEIARLENLCESKNKEKEELEQKLKEMQEALAEVEERVKKEIEALEAQREELFKKKSELIKSIPQQILVFYEKVRRWAGNTAVVPVKKQACMGCYMKINDKTYAQVIKAEEIITCPHCGRILYLEEEEV
jgi:predicted  nucleic acid-binding Zn-ribbon protein